MTLVSKVTERVRAYYQYGSTRYTDAELREMVHAADCAIRECTELTYASLDIPLQANTIYYSLPSDVIRVRSVLYSLDGTTFDDGVLKPCVFSDLDSTYRLWSTNTGATPEHYGILGTPGSPSAYLFVWMPLSTIASQTVRVFYTKCYPDNDAAFAALDDVDDKVIDACYVPHVLSQIYAIDDIHKFQSHWLEYMAGVDKMAAHYASRYQSFTPRLGVGMSDGQLA